jgi:hypothetical protein
MKQIGMSGAPQEPKVDPVSKRKRDWFGYVVTGLVGLVITIFATWYQINLSDEQANSAEKERARSVRQSVISIVEDQILNGKKLEHDRVTRLIDQRRREQGVSSAISLVDIVQQAEYNIISSTYLSVDRKEEIKAAFDAFYADLASRSFEVFPPTAPNAELLNQLAKQIQEGQNASALSSLRQLQEIHQSTVENLSRELKPSIVEAVKEFFGSPFNIAAFFTVYVIALMVFFRLNKRRRERLSDILRRNL